MVATAAALVLLAAVTTGAEARYGFTFQPSAGPKDSSFTLSFRAPYDEGSENDTENSYEFWLHGPRDSCIRDWFGPFWGARSSIGREGDLTGLARSRHVVLRINGRPRTFIGGGDLVVLRFRAPPCVGRYWGNVKYEESFPGSVYHTRIGTFQFRVTA